MADFLDEFIKELLHLDDVRSNRLLHIGADGENTKCYFLSAEDGSANAKIISAIKRSKGRVSNRTVLKDSAQVRTNADNPNVEKWLWRSASGESNPALLDKFITEAYNVINLKGNNPLFLGLGSLTWEIAVSEEMRRITSPLLIFPIKLIRGTATSSVEIEFVDDDAFFNPVLYEKLKRTLTGYVYENFPHPNGLHADFDEPVNLENLHTDYFDLVQAHVEKCGEGSKGIFQFDANAVTIAQYNHSDMCMYYDVKRNRAKIEEHPLIRRIFGGQANLPQPDDSAGEARFVLAKDSVQEEVIRRILRGQSLIIKGPPGTGKTLTIANMIAALIARGKKVLFASKKLAALSEVNAKLPEKLRKFCMLLDFETEQKAASVNPQEIKKQFKELLRQAKEYHFDKNVSVDYERAMREQASAVLDINDYFKEVFLSGYYDAADTYFKSNLPAVEFIDALSAAKLTKGEYGALLSLVEEAGKAYAVLSEAGTAVKSPWFGVGNSVDTESAFARFADISKGLEKIIAQLSALGYGDLSEIALGDLYEINANTLDKESVIKIASSIFDRSALDANLAKLKAARENAPLAEFAFTDSGEEKCFNELKLCKADKKLTKEEIILLSENSGLLIAGGKPAVEKPVIEKMFAAADKINAIEKCSAVKELEILSVFDKLKESDYKTALKTHDCLSVFYHDGKKVGLFDFKAKKYLKLLRNYSSRSNLSFDDIAGAIIKLKQYVSDKEEAATLRNIISSIFGNTLTEDGFKCIFLLAEKCGENYVNYLNEAYIGGKLLKDCLNFTTAPENFVLEDLLARREEYEILAALNKKCEEIAASAGVEFDGNAENFAKSVSVILRLREGKVFNSPEDIAEFLHKIKNADESFSQEVWNTAKKMRDCGLKYFENAYTANPWVVTVKQAERFIEEAHDRSILSAALSYDKIKNGDNALNLAPFFESIENGEVLVECDAFKELFEHSYFKLLINYRLQTLGKKRNGLGKNAELNMAKFEASEAELLKCNASIIENLCMARINNDDPDFNFLDADRGIPKSLRYLFKTHADAILKLKPCIILSPSTASVLMRGEEYFDFDVVIIDEASQLEPVNLLPVLVRSKQCVLVGDEFQMPPLTHFKAKNKQRIDDMDSELSIDTDISALSLALHNSAFEATELVCHYRSNTESLIAFSQREFYPFMRTFPTAEPFKDGLGFEDVFTPDGCCDGGVNAVEAKKAVEKLEEHFNKYYDESKGKLSRSVGVVAFGEAQLKYIQSLVDKSYELTKKIRTATLNFDDLPEKLVFFRTIESVQGQETDSLILSLTYGRDKNGALKLAFGELNRDALGKNIFNVAITRAQSKITVIHSVRANEIGGNPRIAFIKDYLMLVEQFSSGGKSQFVQSIPEYGANFAKSVIDFIVENGIPRERIVQNYGVTDGSVKIPIAILSKDLTRADLGIWCEYPVLNKYDYLDYNVRYVRSLQTRGWNIVRIFIHEWLDNSKTEKKELLKAIKPLI